LLLKEGEGEEEKIKTSVVLYLAMRLVKLPATEPLFLLKGTGRRGVGDHDLYTWL
jgi:hypothetical protein